MNNYKENGLRVLFLYANQRSMSLVPPAIGLFSSLLKERGIYVDLFDTSDYKLEGNDSDAIDEQNLNVRPLEEEEKIEYKESDVFEDLDKKIREFKPNLIAATATDSTILLTIELLKSVRKYNILTILGGVFPTFAPEKSIKFQEVDMICIGDGEVPLTELCMRLANNQDYSNIPNLWVKKDDGTIIKNKIGPIMDINKLPDSDLSIFEEKRLYRMMGGKLYRMLPIETHRGCPYMCTYCGSPTQNQMYKEQTGYQYFRKKSIDKVKQTLLHYQNRWKAEYFFFWADTFFSYTDEEINEFCDMYEKIHIPFYAQARPETINEHKIKRLKEVGLERIGVGIEHGNEKYRREVLKRYYSNEQAIKALSIIHKHGIRFSLNNIIGLPEETPELVMDTIELNRQIKGFDDASCSIFQPYHGTPLRELCIRKGYISDDLIPPHNSDQSFLNMPQFPKERIAGLQRTFAMYIRFPRNRWDEIKMAEKYSPEGNATWSRLRRELINTYF